MRSRARGGLGERSGRLRRRLWGAGVLFSLLSSLGGGASPAAERLSPSGEAQRAGIPGVVLRERLRGLDAPVDLRPVPGSPGWWLIIEKGGRLLWWSEETGQTTLLRRLPVRTSSEQGLLSLAFSPDFQRTRALYLYRSPARGRKRTQLERWRLPRRGAAPTSWGLVRAQVLLEIEQPYSNHNGGQLQFSHRGQLFLGVGDGGAANDPLRAGQDPAQLLGKILRLDVSGDRGAYQIPADNPFRGRPGYRPEIWALGLRNPWRMSFDQRGRLWVADVGQGQEEEVSIAPRGGNLGWSTWEGRRCFRPPCGAPGVPPRITYGRALGASITGGYHYQGRAIPWLRGAYLYGDFSSGRLWALLPDAAAPRALGRFPISPSTFGRSSSGELLIADLSGVLYQLEARGDER